MDDVEIKVFRNQKLLRTIRRASASVSEVTWAARSESDLKNIHWDAEQLDVVGAAAGARMLVDAEPCTGNAAVAYASDIAYDREDGKTARLQQGL